MKKLLTSALALLFFTLQLNALSPKEEDTIVRDFLWQKFVLLPKEKRPKVGLTLSAGGMRGFSHVGAIEVLSESGLPIDYVAGTSMGCVVGSLYAAGVSSERLWQLASNPQLSFVTTDLNLIGVAKYFLGGKLFSSERFESFIDTEVGGLYFESLNIPLACVSADIKTGEKIIFDSGPLARGVRASMNLPGIFEPLEYRQRYLVDGGVTDYMPVDIVKEMGADWTLAVYALPDYSKTVPSTILGYILRTSDIRGAFLTGQSEREANFVIASRVGEFDTVANAAQTIAAAEIGAKTTYHFLGEMKENLLLFSTDYVFK